MAPSRADQISGTATVGSASGVRANDVGGRRTNDACNLQAHAFGASKFQLPRVSRSGGINATREIRTRESPGILEDERRGWVLVLPLDPDAHELSEIKMRPISIEIGNDNSFIFNQNHDKHYASII